MKGSELRDLSIEELTTKSSELRAECFNARVKHSTGQLENTARLNLLRQYVIRGCYGDADGCVNFVDFTQYVQIPQHKIALGDDVDRETKFRYHL